jgi:hypothetical protein
MRGRLQCTVLQPTGPQSERYKGYRFKLQLHKDSKILLILQKSTHKQEITEYGEKHMT